MTAFTTETGDPLWSAQVPPSNFDAVQPLAYVMPQQHIAIEGLNPVLESTSGCPEPSDTPSVSYQCRWAGCGDILHDGSVAAVKRHLREVHHTGQADCPSGVKDYCKWQYEGNACGRLLDIKSFAKHIASVHLKSTAARCADCGTTLGRADSLNRHRRDHCTARRDFEEPVEYAVARVLDPL